MKVGMASGAKGEFWTRERNRDFLGFVRRIITIPMDLVPGTTGQFILSLSQQYSYHSLNECISKIDENGYMESLRAYLRYGSPEHNWQVESRWIG